jgi:serine/threonine protein kinase
MTTIAGPARDEPPAEPQEIVLADLLDRALDSILQGKAPSVRSLIASDPETVAQGERLLNGLWGILGPGRSLREQSRLLESELLALAADSRSDVAPLADAGQLPDPFPGEFRVRRRLGAGAFGTVWLAEDLHLARYVALKTVRPPELPELAARWLEQLRAEARALASVRHRNVVQVFAWREALPGEHYLVLQYVPGGSLADRVRQQGPLPWALAARYVADVAEGLLAVHARGIIHRDVKPANILWNPDTDEALLTDFSVAARRGDGGEGGGTPSYMPPEAFDGVVGFGQDVYGLAASLFWLVTGSVPFPGRTPDEVLSRARRGLPSPDPRCVDLPAALERLIRDGLAAERSRRPELRDFATALRGTLNRLLADSLLLTGDPARQPAAQVRLTVSRQVGRHTFVPVAASHPLPERLLRDVRLVPREPDRVEVRTGDRLRIEVEVDRPGYVTVFNVGPTGNLTRLHPPPGGRPAVAEPRRPLRIGGTVLTPPAGSERLVAVWSREPLTVRLEDVLGQVSAPGPYRATRDIALLEESVHELPAEARHAAVVELDHRPPVEEHP